MAYAFHLDFFDLSKVLAQDYLRSIQNLSTSPKRSVKLTISMKQRVIDFLLAAVGLVMGLYCKLLSVKCPGTK